MSGTSLGRHKFRGTFVRIVLSISGVLILVATSGSFGSARAGPDRIGPPPPGSCPTSATITFGAGLMTNSTNVTLQYWVVYQYSYQWYFANTNVSWGPNTSYGYRAQTNQPTGSSYPNNAFIDYLNPSTTYYFSLVGRATCLDSSGHQHIYNGYFYGQWTTGSEQTYYNSWGITMRGVVRDANNNLAPSGVYVEVKCTSGDDSYWGTTNSNGAYSIRVSDWLGRPGCTADGGYYSVEVLTMPHPLGISGLNSTQWSGHWNETLVLFAPQKVNIYDTTNYLGPMTPLVLDYTNDAFVTFRYESTFYTSTNSCGTFNTRQF